QGMPRYFIRDTDSLPYLIFSSTFGKAGFDKPLSFTGLVLQNEKTGSNTKRRILFCEMNPFFYWISCRKETVLRHLKNFFTKERFAKEISHDRLPNLVSSWHNALIKKGKGIDPVLQENKADNINLACRKMNGLVIHPGETFSFWSLVGKPSRKNGFKEGRVIEHKKLIAGFGGGLCNLGNTIHILALHSPLTVTEIHHHSDALAPDHGKRIPYSAGTSVSYNNVDFRFRNDTDQNVQLLLWCDSENLYGELRSEKEFPWTYKIAEEGHHFHKEGEKYFRVSKIYKETYDRRTNELLKRELNWNNHSEVMFDYAQIPAEQIV
ncbi:MAG: VanW family protein, partial [Treponema sp.]|nr:VanW family protein [Treponema sp.]